MTSEEILASITAHYLVTAGLTASQLQEHKRRGACWGCEPTGDVEAETTANCDKRQERAPDAPAPRQ